MKRKSRPKSTPKKPERKPKGSVKGPPKSKGGGKDKAPAREPPAHPEPTEHAEAGKPDLMYGGFTLRLYDHDKQGKPSAVYDGKLRDVIFVEPIPVPAATSSGAGAKPGSFTVLDGDTRLIAKLQRHLWSLGFWVFPREIKDGMVQPVISGVFDWRTEWAVREFQIAAAMPNVAVQDIKKKPTEEECKSTGKYLSKLSAKKNACGFKGIPSGVVDQATRDALKYWLDKNYRCPVVIQAFRMKPDPSSSAKAKKSKGKRVKMIRNCVHTENIWRHDEVTDTRLKMFAWDFSGHFQLGDHPNKEIPVGSFRWDNGSHKFCGPTGDRRDSWPEAQLTPKSWRGKEWSSMAKEEKSTWRAIMAVANRECAGALDVVNFWDNCHGSAGHYHWTMPKISKGVVSSGEFCGFMAMLEEKYPNAFKRCFTDFGLWGPRWQGCAADGERKPVAVGVTFGGYVYCKNDKGQFIMQPEARRFAEASWLRSWHSAYRLEMAARTCAEYREAMWEYARIRIVGICKMAQVNAWLPDECRTNGAKVTLGDIFKSEQGMAFALRLHVWRPASFINATRELVKTENKKTGKIEEKWEGLPILHDALKKLFAEGTLKDVDGKPIKDEDENVLEWKSPISDWKDDHERILIDTMLDFAGKYAKESAKSGLQLARYWPLALRDKTLELAQKRSDADKPKKEGEPVGPMLHVREPAPGLPSPPKRDGKVAKTVIKSDLDQFAPSGVRGSFDLAD